MRKNAVFVIIAVLFLILGYIGGIYFPVNQGVTKANLNTEVDTFAYGVGINMGNAINQNVGQMNITEEFDNQTFISGIRDGLEGNEEIMSNQEAQMNIQQYVMKKSQELQEGSMQEAEENLQAGEVFLEQNKEKEVVNVTESGLQYEILEEGSGVSPESGDTVEVSYTGMLIDGTVFDSSEEPVRFTVGNVIEGWNEALKMMKPGSKWKLYIPSDLAYGDQQRGQYITPNSTLIFEVELHNVSKQ